MDPWIGVLVALVGAPLSAGLAFMLAYSAGLVGLLAHGFTLAAWRQMLSDPDTWITIGFSFWIGAASLGVSVVIAFAVHALRAACGAAPIRSSLTPWHVPLAVPPLVAALLVLDLLGNAGLIARIAHALGWLSRPQDFASPVYARSGLGIILTQAALATPFLVLLFERLARNERLDELADAARTLGACGRQVLLRVRLPVLLRAAMPALCVYLLALSGAFEVPLLVGAQYPSMISVSIWRSFARVDLSTRPEAFALASFYALLGGSLLFALFAARRHRESRERAT